MALLEQEYLRKIIESKSDREIDLALDLHECLKAQDVEREEAYSDGLTSSSALYTSYKDLLQIHQDLCQRNIKSFADLGAGISRSKILFDYLRNNSGKDLSQNIKTATYEFVKERVKEAKRVYQKHQLPDVDSLHHWDILKNPLPDHEAYFIYLPVGPTLKFIIQELKRLSCQKERILYVIESHGDLINYIERNLPEAHLIHEYTLYHQ